MTKVLLLVLVMAEITCNAGAAELAESATSTCLLPACFSGYQPASEYDEPSYGGRVYPYDYYGPYQYYGSPYYYAPRYFYYGYPAYRPYRYYYYDPPRSHRRHY